MFSFLLNPTFLAVIKALAASSAPIVYGAVRKRYELRKTKDDNKFGFIESFLKEDIKQKHHLVVEQAFLKYLGRSISYDEIIFLVELQNPMSSLDSFFMAQNYVAYDSRSKTIGFKSKYKNTEKLKRLKYWHMFLYFFFAAVGMLLLLFSFEFLRQGGLIVLPVLVAFVFMFFGAAYWQIYDSSSIYFAEKLIKHIKESTGEA